MNIKPVKERVNLSASDNAVLRKRYLEQVVVQIIETLKLHFFAIDVIAGLEIDFDELLLELKELVEVEGSTSITVLALSSRLIEHEMFEVRVHDLQSSEAWNALEESVICFLSRATKPTCYDSYNSALTLDEFASWINKKICLTS
jgi:hypothetical protein